MRYHSQFRKTSLLHLLIFVNLVPSPILANHGKQHCGITQPDSLISEGIVKVLVEIPVGSNKKLEYDKRSGVVRQEIENGRPREISYLGYPANYGFIFGTMLPREDGGDGDPIDAFLLGPALKSGSIVSAKVIGGLSFYDQGEKDFKVITVQEKERIFGEIQNIEALEAAYPGIVTILSIWLENYKRHGQAEVVGVLGKNETQKFIYQFSNTNSIERLKDCQ